MKTYTKIKRIMSLLLLSIASIATAETVDQGWCTITTPDSKVSKDEFFDVKITIKDPSITSGKLSCDFHWFKQDGSWGGLGGANYQLPKTISSERTYIFKCKATLKDEMGNFNPFVYASPDGNFNNLTHKANGAKIIPNIVKEAAPVETGATTIVDRGWCTIETPNKIIDEQAFDVKITIKDPSLKGNMLSCDVHWMKSDGWGGTFGWNPPKKIDDNTTYTFKVRGALKPEMNHLYPYVFYSANGNFQNKIKDARGATISLNEEVTAN